MDLVTLLVTLVILAIVFWLVTQFLLPLVPAGPFRTAILVIFILICILVLLSLVGIVPNLSGIRVGK